MAKHEVNAGRHTAIALAFLTICLQACQGWDACLEGPWLDTGTADSETVSVSLSTFDQLQQHIDAATGPTAFVIKSVLPNLVAKRPVQISKPDITISSSNGLLSNDAAGEDAPQLSVDCASAGSLLQIRAPGFRLLGFHISGCSSSAVQLVSAKRAILRNCTFSSHTNNVGSIGGAAVAASKSQLWVDSCGFSQNSVAAGPGGALSTVSSQVFITNSQFSSNKAADAGGAVAFQGRADAALTSSAPACWKDVDSILDTVTLEQNHAALQGGALAANGSHVAVQASAASSNTAKYGGVIYAGQAAQVAVRSGSSMTGNSGTSSGGVVYAIGPGVLVILQSSSFAANTADVLGGVLSAKEAAGIRIDGSIFSNNTAKLAAGVIYARDADMSVSTSQFTSNTATRDGGALYCAGNCNWAVKYCQFDSNKCGANGGAVFGWNLIASISSSSLLHNAAGALGGAVSVANSTLDMSSCMVGSNSATGSDAAGGGVYSQSSTLNLTDSTFSSNTATWGGAVYATNGTLALAGGSITNSSVTGSGAGVYALRTPTSLIDVKFEYNDAAKYAGSLYCHASSCSLSGCTANYDSASLGAGSIWVGYGSIAIRSSHIHGCVAKTEGGGGLQALGGANVSMVASSFTSCSALKATGGGMDLSNVASVLIRGSLFSANRAMTGGSIALSNSSITIGGSGLFNSTATAGGCLAAVSNSTVALYNGTAISGNAAAVGGGVALDNTTFSVTGPVAVWQNKALAPATVAVATAVKQTATFGSQQVLRGIAGGIYAQDSRIVATGLKLERNTADRVGGGGYWDRCRVRSINSSISRNTATEEAGGLKMLNPATGSALISCTVAANWAGVRGGGLSLAGVDLVTDVALVDVQLMNNTAAGQAAGGLYVSGPMGLLMVGGELSGNAAGAAAAMAGAAAEYSSFTGLSADGFGSSDTSSSTSAGLEAAGGGMLLEGCSWAALQGVDVWGNAAPAGCGGGIAVTACGKFMLNHTTVEGNVAASGGGACIVDIPGYLTIYNSSVSSNRALLGGVWGGIGSSLAPTPEPHLSCRVPGTGGGLCIDSLGQVLINSTRVSKNQARNGGAMALGACQDSTVCSLGLFGATFTNNTAVQGGGGAVYFTTAVAPDQVMCGEDYNTSAAIDYVAGTTYPTLEVLLETAAFNTTPVAVPSSKTSAAAVVTNSSNSAEEDIVASTAGSAPSGLSSSSAGGTVPSSSGDDNSDDYTETDSYDPTAAATTSTGTPATTVNFSAATPTTPAASVAGSSQTTSSMRVTSEAAATPAAANASIAAAAAAPGVKNVTSTGALDSSSGGGTAATTATAGTHATASTAEFEPTGVSAVSFDPASGASTSNFLPESAQVNSSEWDTDVVATEGYDPTAMTTDTQEFGTASVVDPAAIAANQQQAAGGASQAAFQARSAAAAAAASGNSSSTTAKGGALIPESGQYESGAQVMPNDMGQIDVRNAKEALRVLQPPVERTYTFSVGNGLTASTTEFVDAAAKAQAADKVLRAAVQDGNSSTAETQGMQPAASQVSAASTASAVGSLSVPVTVQILAQADEVGVSKSVTARWRQSGLVKLQELLNTGVVSQSTLDQFWNSETGPSTVTQLPKRSDDNAHSYDMYLALAVALTQAQAAAAVHAKLQQGDHGSTGSWDWGSSLSKFNPYITTCDPVQNPAACPVPNKPSTPESAALNADTRTALAAATAAALAAGGNAAVTGDAAAVLSSITSGGRRRLLEIDEAAAEQEAAAAVEAAVAAGGQQSEAPTTGLILQGTSQCGTFENNTAIGAKSYGPVVTSRPAGLRVFDGPGDPTGPAVVMVATGGTVQVQIHVVDVFGGVVTSGAADYIRIKATLQNPNPGSALSGTSSAAAAALAAAPGLAAAQAVAEALDGDKEVDSKGVILSGLQQLSTSNGSLVLSGLRLSGQPGTNTTLWFKASDPSLLPASVTISLTSCSAGYMQLPGSCQLCLPGTYSFSPDEPRCATCPLGATCNGTVLVPQSGYWHSGPRSSQVHVCLNPAACSRDSFRRQQLADWQMKNYGQGLIVGKSKAEASRALEWYMTEQCAAGYTGTLCANCAQNAAALAANRVSHGRIAGACVECGDHKTVLGMYILARIYDLVLWAALTWLAWRAAKAWAKAITLNPATAAATSGSLPPTSAAAAGSQARVLCGEKGANSVVLVTSEAAAAAVAGVGTSAALQAHVWVFLDYLQMLSIISCSAVSYAWPRLLQTFMIGFSFVPLGTSKWVSVECLLPYHLSYRRSIVGLLLTAAVPLFYLGASTGVWVASLMMGKTHRTPILALVVGTCLFYPLVTMSALSTFSCQYIDNPQVAPGEAVSAPGSYWTVDPDLKCYEGQHLQVMLGFGVPVVLLVVLAWPLLLASMLWDSRFRIREQQQHPATRRRYLVRKTIKLCHQLLGVMSGFYRPGMYLWPVLVEVRKLVLCVVVVLASGSAPAAQLYVLWGVLAVLLLLEWWVKPGSNWPLVGLQLVAMGALQATVYLASAFTQVTLQGSVSTFIGLIISVSLLVAVAFLLSLVAALRGRGWLRKALDADNDGKVSSTDLVQSAGKLLHLSIAPNTGVSSSSSGGASSPRKRNISSQQQAAGSSNGTRLVTGSPSRLANWRMVFTGGKGKAGTDGEASAAPGDGDGSSNRSDQQRQHSRDDAAGQDQRAATQSPRRQHMPAPGYRLAAGSLPIADAGNNSISAAAAAAAAAAVNISASIDMGALHKLTASRAGSSLLQQQLIQAAAAAGSPGGSTSASPVPPPVGFVAVDMGQYSGSGQQQRQQQQQAGLSGKSTMSRAKSAQAAVPGSMPLQTYLSVHQWLTESEELSQQTGHADSSGWPSVAGSGPAAASLRGPRHSTRSLQEYASSPGPYPGSGSGSMALQRQQMLQQLQVRQQEGHQHAAEDVDVHNLRSVSQDEEHQQQRYDQQHQPSTGHAAAARLSEVRDGASAAARSNSGVSTRHQPYYALWSSVATALADPAASSGDRSTPHSKAKASAPAPAAAGSSGSAAMSAAAVAAAVAAAAATGVVRSAVKPSPFAAPAAVQTAFAADPAALVAAAAAAGAAGVAVRGVSMPAGKPAAQHPFAAAAAIAAAAATGKAAAAGPPARHAAYYNVWQQAGAQLSDDAASANTASGAAAESSSAAASSTPTAAGTNSSATGSSAPVMAQRSATAPPGRHNAYIGLWQTVADEVQDGPSAVGANAAAPVPVEVAAAIAAQQLQQQQQEARAPVAAGRRVSPFAAMAAAAAAMGGSGGAAAASINSPSDPQQQQEQQQQRRRQRSGRLSRRGRRSSAAGVTAAGVTAAGVTAAAAAVNDDDDAGSDASAYCGAPLD